VAHDITQSKQAEVKLKSVSTRQEAILAAIPDILLEVDKNKVYTWANPTGLAFFGEDLVGKEAAYYFEGEQDTYNIIQPLFNGSENVISVESWQRRKDGEKRLLAWLCRTLKDQDGNVTGALSSALDITDRKLMEDKLDEERILLRTLIDNLPDRVYAMDVQGRKILSNISDWQASGGKRMEDVIGKTDFDTYPPELAKDYWDHDKTVIDTGISIINREEVGLDSQGNPAWVLTSKVPLHDSTGKVTGLVGIGHDITNRKQQEEEIQSRNEELTTLYQLSRLLAEAGDLESVNKLVIRHAVESLHITFACLALMEEGELVMRAVHPVRVLDHEFIIGDRQPITTLPVCQSVLEKNEPVILQAGGPGVGSLEYSTLRLDFARSVCLVPLWIDDDPQGLSNALGLLILGEAREEKREPFTPEKIRLARSIGDQAAAAIRRMLLHEHAGRRLKHLASISEIDRTIVSSFDLRLSLQMVLKHVMEQLEVDAADVLVLNDSIQALEFADGRGFHSKAIERTRLRLGEGQAGQAALERRIIQIPDLATSGAVFAQPELLEKENIAAYFAVPLITKGMVKGVLEIFQRSPLAPNAEWLDFLNTLAGQAAIAIDNIQMFENLQRSTDELELAYDATIEGWSHALDLRDKETEGHAMRVTNMTFNLARIFDLSEAELVQIRWGALLHDIGKMGVPDGILLKPGPLTDEEWVAMKKHPTFAYEMLSPIRYLRLALDIPYCHHEKWDGSGYPRGLKGEQIPLAARIFAVVDVYDALTSDRPYRKAWSKEKALENIKVESGKYFDPQVVKAFLEMKQVADDR
jgi:PAS domain S-box-containing protein/putative nucleotidyltransferase with HDIG domain